MKKKKKKKKRAEGHLLGKVLSLRTRSTCTIFCCHSFRRRLASSAPRETVPSRRSGK